MKQMYRPVALMAATSLMLCVAGASPAAAEESAVSPPAKLALEPVSLPPELFAVPALPQAPKRVTPARAASATYSAALLSTKPHQPSGTSPRLAAGTRKTADVSTPAHGSSERERAVVVRISLPF